MFTNANPFAPFFKSFPQNMQNMADSMKVNASGPFGIPTFASKQDQPAANAFDPFNMMKGMDMPALKNMFPTDFMKPWQDAMQGVSQAMNQNMNSGSAFKPFATPFATSTPTMPSMPDFASMTKVSGIDWSALMEAQKKNMEAFVAAHHSMLASCQQLGKRQGEMFQETMQTAAQLMTDMMATGTPEEKLGRQVDIAKQAFDLVSKHLHELSELSAQGQTQALDVVTERVQASLDELKKSAQAAESTMHSAAKKATQAASDMASKAASSIKTAAATGDMLN